MAKSYADKLKDPRWQKKRLEILQRDNFTCRFCFNESETLHVHHLYYEANCEPHDYPNESLITLCETCHKNEVPKIKELEKNIFRNIRVKTDFLSNWQDVDKFFERFDNDFLFKFFCVWSDDIFSADELMDVLHDLNLKRHDRQMAERKKANELVTG